MSFDRLGRFAVRRRWWIVGAWAVLILAALPFAPQAPGALSAGGFILDDLESAKAKQLLQDELGVEPSAFVLVYTSDTLTAGTPEWLAAVTAATRDVPRAPHVTRVLSHVLAPNQVSADAPHRVRHRVPRPPARRLARRDPGRHGPPPRGARDPRPGRRRARRSTATSRRVTERDLQRSEVISLPLAALALLLVFGSLVAAGVPLAVGGASVLVALAGIFLVASVIPMSIFVLNLATLLGLGLGVDYSLLMTSRFREELAHRDGPDRVAEAVRVTVATAGRAVFFSGLTVLLGLLGLVLFEFMILRSVGIAGAIVVGLAVAGGDHAAAGDPRDPRHPRRPAADPVDHRRAVARRPVGAPRPAGDAPPGRGPRADPDAAARPRAAVPPRPVQCPGRLDPPAGVPSREAYDVLAREFGEGEFAPLVLAVRTTGDATTPDNLASLYAYSRRLAADPRCRRVASLVDVDPRRDPRPVPAALRLPGRPAGPVRLDGAGRDDEGRPDRVHRSTRPTARTATRVARSPASCATPRARWRRPRA